MMEIEIGKEIEIGIGTEIDIDVYVSVLYHVILCYMIQYYTLPWKCPKVLPYRSPQGTRCFLTACHKQTNFRFPLSHTAHYGLEGTTSANRSAASRNYQPSWLHSPCNF